MSRRAFLSFGDRAVEIFFPDRLHGLFEPLFFVHAKAPRGSTRGQSILIGEDGPERYSLGTATSRTVDLSLGDVLNQALLEAHREVVGGFGPDAVVLHAAAVARNGRAILIPGESRTGKSTLAAWLINAGFDYISDDVSAFTASGDVKGLYRPLALRPDVWPTVSRFGWATTSYELSDGRRLVQAPPRLSQGDTGLPARLILVPEFEAGSAAQVEIISPALMATHLMAANHSTAQLPDHGLQAALSFARSVPAVRLRYGRLDQLDALKPFLIVMLEGRTDAHRLSVHIAEANAALAAMRTSDVPATWQAPTPKKGPTKLTIGMATYDDYDGVFFTVQALRMYHPEVLNDVQFLLIDNQPDGPAAPMLKQLDYWIDNFRYVPYAARSGTAVRDLIFEEAEGTYVLCVDCHVLLVPGSIKKLIDYYDAHPDTSDLLQGPLLYDGLKTISTHFEPGWRAGMFGTWDVDPRGEDPNGPPFEIPSQGLGIFSCRRAAWPGFNPRFRGFGGEEGYIHEKFRQRGDKALCLPFLRWVHRFGRPHGTTYVNSWEDRVANYIIGRRELGLPIDDVLEHFTGFLDASVWEAVARKLEPEFGRLAAPAKSGQAA